jgi:hypothetical protein
LAVDIGACIAGTSVGQTLEVAGCQSVKPIGDGLDLLLLHAGRFDLETSALAVAASAASTAVTAPTAPFTAAGVSGVGFLVAGMEGCGVGFDLFGGEEGRNPKFGEVPLRVPGARFAVAD